MRYFFFLKIRKSIVSLKLIRNKNETFNCGKMMNHENILKR